MKPLNITLLAVATAALRTQSSDAFIPNLISSRETGIHTPPSSSSTVRNPSTVVMNSSAFDNASPNDQVIREEYAKWRQKYSKGEFDALRYENFKANFMAVTVRNNMERTRARQNGEAAPSPIALNEFGDCSADEYRTAMGQQQQYNSNNNRNSSGPRRVPSANSQPLQPSNTIINTSSTSSKRNSNSNSNNSRSNNSRSVDLTNASAQLRTVIQERTGMERELVEMKKLLEEKKKLLEIATKEEQEYQQRIALREEQKRLLNDRLTNGWEDEREMNDNYY